MGHAPGWKHPLPAMVTVDETVKSEVGKFLSKRIAPMKDTVQMSSGGKSIEGPPGKQDAMPGNLEI